MTDRKKLDAIRKSVNRYIRFHEGKLELAILHKNHMEAGISEINLRAYKDILHEIQTIDK